MVLIDMCTLTIVTSKSSAIIVISMDTKLLNNVLFIKCFLFNYIRIATNWNKHGSVMQKSQEFSNILFSLSDFYTSHNGTLESHNYPVIL